MESFQFPCPFVECGKAFKARKSLVEHMRIHKGEKPYQCHHPGCGKSFTQYSSMQKHERTHTGDKPYKCNMCDKEFTQISNLKRHERVHAGEKPHECEICQKKFSTASNLKQHMHIHEKGEIREKHFCEICNKTYLYRSSLRKHLLEHEEEGMTGLLKANNSTDEASNEDDEIPQTKTKVEPELVKKHEKKSRNNRDKKVQDEIFQEPELSKYIFIDSSLAIKPATMALQSDSDVQSASNENPKSPEIQQEKFNIDIFPDSPSAYIYRPDLDADCKPPLSPLLDSPIRDLPFANSVDYNFIRPKTSSSVLIRYKGEIYYLYDRMLNRPKGNGELVICQIDNDHVNPSGCYHLPEVSHYSDYHSLIQVYREIASKYRSELSLEMLLSDKNCNSLNCNCGSEQRGCKKCNCGTEHTHPNSDAVSVLSADKFLASPNQLFQDECLSDSPLRDGFTQRPQCQEDHICLCEITREYKHVHGPMCGHPAIYHDGHLDYIVDGKLHHPDGDHCDDHGPICVIDNTSEEFANNFISSNAIIHDGKFKQSLVLSGNSP